MPHCNFGGHFGEGGFEVQVGPSSAIGREIKWTAVAFKVKVMHSLMKGLRYENCIEL